MTKSILKSRNTGSNLTLFKTMSFFQLIVNIWAGVAFVALLAWVAFEIYRAPTADPREDDSYEDQS